MLVALVTLVGGCALPPAADRRSQEAGPDARPAATSTRSSAATPTSVAREVTASLPPPGPPPAWAAGCPVTRPGGVPLPPEVAAATHLIFGAGTRGEGLYGRPGGALWVGGLPDTGALGIEPGTRASWKLGWWRGRDGRLTLAGGRLDAPGPPMAVSVPDGYGARGFQATGVVFPSEGCWEILGRAGGEELRLVVLLLLRS